MSRVGNKSIALPEKVSVSVENGNTVTVKGPKGELSQSINPDIKLEIADGELKVIRPNDQKRFKALHGLYRALVNNMVTGVSTGYRLELEIVGVGYKAVATNNILQLTLGYSHDIYVAIPTELKVTSVTEKGQNPKVILEGIDKQLIGDVAAKIRSLRKVEPYKGKGIRFVGEKIRRKAGKSASKK
ncbi:50S ribosomal protein L6 [Larkinella humicola]|uniref:Large ribosomal subunit protein uL6 n=1 Tax=Larkinella humicola TaxID=2607654 RepID=A0A5N1JK98_9BACT|nr:50S ribosomal protein L6 [Larkinella humicola]KAA9353773.1 50S ribosomal protein L6 [Larkinella humicola]